MGVSALILLSCLGFAIQAQAQNCSKPVGGPNMHLKVDAILQDTFVDGSKVSFGCAVGYTSAGGSPTITCTAGSWSDLRLVCERKSCGALEEISNGNIEYPNGDTLFGDKAVVTCNAGYILVGNKEIRCGSQGWMDRLPVCEVMKCSTPGAIENGGFSPEKEFYNYLDVVRYSCNPGFTLNGSRESVCSENEKFLPEPPKCALVECKDPVIPNAEFVEGSRPPHKFSATVTYKCKPGYKMVGESTVTCDINSQWSPRVPHCREIKCTSPEAMANGTFTPQKELYSLKDVVRYSCNPGFTLSGSEQSTCSQDEKFHPEPPKCVWVECKDPVIPNAEVVKGSEPPYKLSSVVTYKCKPGYKMIGEATITCDINSQWLPRVPACKELKCTSPGPIENGVVTPQKDVYSFKDVIRYSCKDEFEITGSAESTCSEDEKFHPEPPKCVDNGSDTSRTTIIAVFVILLVIIIIVLFFVWRKKSKHSGYVGPTLLGVKMSSQQEERPPG
ncbi:C4b-binding protein alpha chain-like isoform X2 [Kryptolebias marmoratus]|uniref:C4b-binding protein alpha chain-like isoform X2 n=1 Tax=Kryptolebias marmoratus TaxID=37003 RepID=UPI0007F901A4|nr:C4b-binding protein alpha chain-like isoform X2 [Kryptolebias marmoratus]